MATFELNRIREKNGFVPCLEKKTTLVLSVLNVNTMQNFRITMLPTTYLNGMPGCCEG